MTAKTATTVPFPFIPSDVFSIIKSYAVPNPVSWVKKLAILKPKIQKYLEKKNKAVCYDFAKGLYASTDRGHYKYNTGMDWKEKDAYKNITKDKILDDMFDRTPQSQLNNGRFTAEGYAPFCLYEKKTSGKSMDEIIRTTNEDADLYTDRMIEMIARHNDPINVEERRAYAEEVAEKYVKHIEYFLLNGKSANP